jgi:hypothetical protein
MQPNFRRDRLIAEMIELTCNPSNFNSYKYANNLVYSIILKSNHPTKYFTSWQLFKCNLTSSLKITDLEIPILFPVYEGSQPKVSYTYSQIVKSLAADELTEIQNKLHENITNAIIIGKLSA